MHSRYMQWGTLPSLLEWVRPRGWPSPTAHTHCPHKPNPHTRLTPCPSLLALQGWIRTTPGSLEWQPQLQLLVGGRERAVLTANEHRLEGAELEMGRAGFDASIKLHAQVCACARACVSE